MQNAKNPATPNQENIQPASEDNNSLSELKMTVSPHIKSSLTTKGVMLDVIIALIPTLIAGSWILGPRALLVAFIGVLSSVLAEYLYNRLMKKDITVGDLSAAVTGLLIALNMPVTIPLWMVAFGSAFAIVVVKQLFGGLGRNFANPAITARIVMLLSFPAAMNNFVMPFQWNSKTDIVTTATPLYNLYEAFKSGSPDDYFSTLSDFPSLTSVFLGQMQGAIGEICAVALLIGFIYLIYRGVIRLAIPVSFVGTVFAVMLIAGKGSLNFAAYQVLTGGLLLGAIFMATDYTTSPMSLKGKIIFGIGCGLITCFIRLFGSLHEGVSYAILIMNLFSPLIDRLTRPRPFGESKKGGKQNAKA